jgi:phosphatidylglycerol:prolipoprotein diacylglycerol transferase
VLPVLFTLRVPAGWGLPLAILAVVLVGVLRAGAVAWRQRGEGFAPFLSSLRWDAWLLALLAGGVALLWRGGLLTRELVLPLHSYGLLLAAGFLGGVALAQREARRRGLDAEALGDLTFWLLVAGVAGSQVLYVILNRAEFSGASFWADTPFGAWPRFLVFWKTGLVFYGGFIGAGLTAFLYMRLRRMPFLPYADALIPAVAFGHFLGRLGCFCAGCCWGSLAGDDVPWGVHFPAGSAVFQAFSSDPRYGPQFLAADHLHTAALHPSQLYEAFGELGLFLLLLLVVRPRKRFEGQLLATWLLAYAVLRGVVELFRGDLQRTLTLGLNSGQWVSVVILAAGLALWVGASRAQVPPAEGPAPV